jgi:hypothetical protein
MHIHYWTQTKEIDLACAITAGAEMGASPKGSADHSAALMVWTFYLGRLSARDDTINWNIDAETFGPVPTRLISSATLDIRLFQPTLT